MAFDNILISQFNKKVIDAWNHVKNLKVKKAIYIYGETGLGKSEILNEIKKDFITSNAEEEFSFFDAKDYQQKFYKKVNKDDYSIEDFLPNYKNIKLFLFDNIDEIFLYNKACDFFTNIFNKMQNQNTIIIVTALKKPDEYNISDRVKARLNSGLIVNIAIPTSVELENIARFIVEKNNTFKLTSDAYEYIATRSFGNIFRIKGLINRIEFVYETLPMEQKNGIITKAFLLKVFSDTPVKKENKLFYDIDPVIIIQKVTSIFNISYDQVISNSKKKEVLGVRDMCIWALKQKFPKITYAIIGSLFGNKKHSAIINSLKKMDAKFAKDEVNKNLILNIIKTI